MSARSSITLSLRSALFLAAAGIIALALLLVGPQGVDAQEFGFGSCIQAASGYDNCTANDLGFGAWSVLDVVGQCSGPTSTVQVLLRGAASSTSQRSDDLAFWINVKGGSAISDPTSNACYRQVLNPVVANPFTGLNLTSGHGPYKDLDGDYCGDILQNEMNYLNLDWITLPCTDSNNDGAIDFNACLSYAQNAGKVCTGYLDALPGTTAKCFCATTAVPVTTIQMTITKSCTPDMIPADATDRAVKCTLTYTNNSTIAASNFSLVDNYDQTKGAVSAIGDTNPGGNPGTDNGDTITWMIPTVPAGGTGSATYTYTVNPGLPEGTIIANTATLYYLGVAQDIATAEQLVIGVPTAVALSGFAAANWAAPALASAAVALLALGTLWALRRVSQR